MRLLLDGCVLVLTPLGVCFGLIAWQSLARSSVRSVTHDSVVVTYGDTS